MDRTDEGNFETFCLVLSFFYYYSGVPVCQENPHGYIHDFQNVSGTTRFLNTSFFLHFHWACNFLKKSEKHESKQTQLFQFSKCVHRYHHQSRTHYDHHNNNYCKLLSLLLLLLIIIAFVVQSINHYFHFHDQMLSLVMSVSLTSFPLFFWRLDRNSTSLN